MGADTGIESVSANALDGPVIALAWQIIGRRRTPPHLFQCRFGPSPTCRRVFENTNNLEGPGVISRDNRSLVVTLAPAEQPQRYSLWLSDLSGDNLRQLSEPAIGSWDASPSWSPDGSEIIFVRIGRSKTDGRLHAALMRVSTVTGITSEVLGESDGIAVASFSPDGQRVAFWSKNGLEVVNLVDLSRTIVRSISRMAGLQVYSGGGLAWSPNSDCLVIPFRNTVINEYQLVTISVDGSDVRTLYSSVEFRIFSVAFVAARGANFN